MGWFLDLLGIGIGTWAQLGRIDKGTDIEAQGEQMRVVGPELVDSANRSGTAISEERLKRILFGWMLELRHERVVGRGRGRGRLAPAPARTVGLCISPKTDIAGRAGHADSVD